MPQNPAQDSQPPLYIAMHAADNVAIVANDGGLPAGTVFASGLTLVDKVPQAHKVALVGIPEGGEVRRYNVVIGYAVKPIAAGSWVHERLLRMPAARELVGLPIATVKPPVQAPLEGYTFEGYRNPDGSVGSRNILAITQTVQCVAGVTDFAVQRIKAELLPRFPNVDDVVALEHSYGCGVAIDAPDAIIPIRTLRNISLNPNFGGEADGGQPGLREAAARTPVAARFHPDQRTVVSTWPRAPTSGDPKPLMSSACRTMRMWASCR